MGPFQGFKMVPCTKSRLFEVPSTFLALKMALAHKVIFKGLFPNIQPHLQHKDIGIFMSPVSILFWPLINKYPFFIWFVTFHFVLVVWYGLVNVPGLFGMCRDCLECAGTVWKCAGTVWIPNSPGTFHSKQSRHNRDLWKSTLFCKVHYVGYSDIKFYATASAC